MRKACDSGEEQYHTHSEELKDLSDFQRGSRSRAVPNPKIHVVC